MQKPRFFSVLASLGCCTAVAALALVLGPTTPDTHAAATDLFFSEYVEGSSTNKALELFNGTGAPIALDGSYDVQIYANGSVSATATIPLSGTVAAADTFVLARAGAAAELVQRADQTTGNFLFNGNDAVALRHDGATIDVIGQVGTDPGAAWTGGDASTLDGTMRRRAGLMGGDADGSNPFDPSDEWDGFPTDTFDGLGSHDTGGGSENTPPNAVADTAEAGRAPIRIDVLANDSDPDGDALSIAALGSPNTGAVRLTDDGRAVEFTPPHEPWTTAFFNYTIRDVAGESSSAEVEIVFVGEPDPDPEHPCEASATLQGTDGPDVLFGTRGDDVIYAGAGNDLVFGLGGDDVICGGAGNDVLFGNGGDDTIVDDLGRTWAIGGAGNDRILTGAQRDRIFGGPGSDLLDGGAGPDLLHGGRGRDSCVADARDRVRSCP
ncbi:MAG: Ig-like domain-containing protein [Gaiellaceae bacterium]